MKSAFALGVLLALAAVSAADASARTARVARHAPASIPASATAQVVLPPFEVAAPPPWLPHIAPYPSNDADDVTGLSRNPDDCNKGCVDIPP